LEERRGRGIGGSAEEEEWGKMEEGEEEGKEGRKKTGLLFYQVSTVSIKGIHPGQMLLLSQFSAF